MFGFLFGSKANSASPAEFKELYDAKNSIILDVRTPAEFGGGHLKGAKNMDWLGGQVQAKAADLDKDKTYFLYCASGNRSGQATKHLISLGFDKVYNVGAYGSVKDVL